MEVDRDRCDHMLPILLPQKSRDEGHKSCHTPYQVRNAALEDAAASLGICKCPCLLHSICCSVR